MTTNKDAIYDPKAVKMAKNAVKDPEGLQKYKEKIEKAIIRKAKNAGIRTNGFLKFCEKLNLDDENDHSEINRHTGRPKKAKKLELAWRDYENKSKYEKKAGKMPDPVTSQYRPDSNFGSVTETIDRYDFTQGHIIDRYSQKAPSFAILRNYITLQSLTNATSNQLS